MAVLPGSLDHLYYNGILDHIPYEAYEMGPMTPSGAAQMSGMGTGYGINTMNGYGMNSVAGGAPNSQMNPYGMNQAYASMTPMNGSQYLQSAQSGLMYNTYTSPDTFVRRSNSNVNIGQDFSIETSAYGESGKNFRESIMNAASTAKESVSNSPNWIKGILAAGIMLTTLCMLFKGKKTPAAQPHTSSFFSRLNPKNWSVDWAKFNPKNWIKK